VVSDEPSLQILQEISFDWQNGTAKARDLETYAKEYLDQCGEIRGNGVLVEYKTEWNEKMRRQKPFSIFTNFTQTVPAPNPESI